MRTITFAAIAAVAATGALLVTGCGPARLQAAPPAATTSVPPTAAPSALPAATTGPAAGTPGAAATVPSSEIPVSTESDSQMTADGNDGPSSSILLPTSCELTGTTVTAQGTYTNGGFVPDVYDRYGDVIELYVLAAPAPGYASGMQLAASDLSESPVLGSSAPWHVSLSMSAAAGVPARCVVAAQPTHDGQFAP